PDAVRANLRGLTDLSRSALGSVPDWRSDLGAPRLAQRRSEARLRLGRPEALEVFGGVRVKVELEGRDRLLDDAPHRLAKVGHEPHEGQGPGVTASIGVEKQALAVGVEVVVDREVAEVEERIAPAGVLPVHDPQSTPVVNEVRVQKVVVAGKNRRASSALLDAPRGLARPAVERWDGDAAPFGNRAV